MEEHKDTILTIAERVKKQGLQSEVTDCFNDEAFYKDSLACIPSEAGPNSREDFLQYACQPTLDPNTAHRNLVLSEGDSVVTWSDFALMKSGHPDRFSSVCQALCVDGLVGRHYWEVEWEGKDVSVAVSYRGINKLGEWRESGFGHNDESWGLYYIHPFCHFWHKKDHIELPTPVSSRIGVYLDHKEGNLSFYEVSDTMTLLHRVQAIFTEPLYPGFWLKGQSHVKILNASSNI